MYLSVNLGFQKKTNYNKERAKTEGLIGKILTGHMELENVINDEFVTGIK